MKILIIGKGFIGSRCAESWPDALVSDTQISSLEDVRKILAECQPDAVLNAAGVVGKPNVDWCDTRVPETIFGNTTLPILIAQACQEKNIYLLHIGTGCVYYGQSPDPAGWREDDFANPLPAYTRSKYAADLVLSTLANVGIARIRMPIDDRPHPANLIDKLTKFRTVVDVENSVTVVPDMINVFRHLLERKAAGIFHVTNPGVMKHRELIALYQELVDPSHRNDWIQEDELLARGLVTKKRSNNILQSKNLEKQGIRMREVREALRDVMQKYAQYIRNTNNTKLRN